MSRRMLLANGAGMLTLASAPAIVRGAAPTSEAGGTGSADHPPNPAGLQAYRTTVPKRPDWGNGAKTVFSVTVHIDGISGSVGRGLVPLGAASGGRYSLRRGVSRQLDLLARYDVPATFMVPAYDALAAPDLFRAVHRAGHELCGHGYFHMPGDGKEDRLRLSHQILTDVAEGTGPKGWCGPGGSKDATTLATLQSLGCIYDASEKDDDLPYLATIGGKIRDDFIILPNNTLSIDDAHQYGAGQALQSEVLDQWIEEFDAIHATTGYYHLTYHSFSGSGSGTPDRTWNVVEKLIQHARAATNVQFIRLADLAALCLTRPKQFAMNAGNNDRSI